MTTTHAGGCKTGVLIHSSRWDAVSAWRARLRRSSRSAPGGSAAAWSRTSCANAASRSLRGVVSLRRRRCCMARLPVREGGSATGDLITDKCQEPCDDPATMGVQLGMHQCKDSAFQGNERANNIGYSVDRSFRLMRQRRRLIMLLSQKRVGHRFPEDVDG